MTTELDGLAERMRVFAEVREWERFHTPKNLAMALAGEVGELVAELQWLTPDESRSPDPETLSRITAELGDVTAYLVRLADVLGVDLVAAAHAKLDVGERRYDPVRYRGSPRKAPHLPPPPEAEGR
ncbi:nucleotide pyrophosphohydrolase [Nonomuraea sp. CA-218870]|uniref:nucleotide pyrophosphohydrolase n=1 Tax=Nonomuraea sp. CA-218870 TaxID=3239998 RepID=UPI003D949B82